MRTLEHLAEPLAGDRLDHLAAPVDVAAVLPLVARIEQQRRHQRRLRRGDNARLALLLREPVVVLVEEVVAQASRVQQQHAGGDVALGRAQLRFALRVEALDHLQLADLGDVGLGRRVEVELALFDELQRRRAGDRLGGREDREHGVGRHGRVAVQPALAGGTFVDVALAVGRPSPPRRARAARTLRRGSGSHRPPP